MLDIWIDIMIAFKIYFLRQWAEKKIFDFVNFNFSRLFRKGIISFKQAFSFFNFLIFNIVITAYYFRQEFKFSQLKTNYNFSCTSSYFGNSMKIWYKIIFYAIKNCMEFLSMLEKKWKLIKHRVRYFLTNYYVVITHVLKRKKNNLQVQLTEQITGNFLINYDLKIV